MSRRASEAAPLDDVMLAMDVVDTLRHQSDLVARELGASAREDQLIERLRALYRDQGIAVPDRILREGVQALGESRFSYTPPPDSFKTRLFRLYVNRRFWGRPAALAGIVLLVLVVGYFAAYRPFVALQADAARMELTQTLPNRIEELYDQIYTETMVQAALEEADPWVARGQAAVQRGDREGALEAVSQLERIHQTLLAQYSLRIVNRPGEPTGVWRFPEANSDATNFYIVVEAIGPNGEALTLPIQSEETGETQEVDTWAVRVPEATYEAVRADRLDDGIIQRNVMGIKQYGFPEIDYLMPVLGGTITQW